MTKARAHSAARTRALGIFCKLPPLGNTGGKKNNHVVSSEGLNMNLSNKQIIIRILSRLLNHSIPWFLFGFILATLATNYVVINSLVQIDKLLVCK